MHDWILKLRDTAIEQLGGAGASEWATAEREVGSVGPDELRELYLELSGATFASGVLLYPLPEVVTHSQSGSAGFPSEDVWRLGRKANQHLAAIPKARVGEIDQAEPAYAPQWFDELPDDAWVYVAFDEQSHGLEVFRTLENLLSSVNPPPAAEEREPTLTRARSLVEAAVTELGALGSAAVAAIASVTKTRKRAKTTKARPTAKKKKTPAAKTKAPVAKKKRATPKKKPTPKPKPAPKRKPTPKRKPAPKRG